MRTILITKERNGVYDTFKDHIGYIREKTNNKYLIKVVCAQEEKIFRTKYVEGHVILIPKSDATYSQTVPNDFITSDKRMLMYGWTRYNDEDEGTNLAVLDSLEYFYLDLTDGKIYQLKNDKYVNPELKTLTILFTVFYEKNANIKYLYTNYEIMELNDEIVESTDELLSLEIINSDPESLNIQKILFDNLVVGQCIDVKEHCFVNSKNIVVKLGQNGVAAGLGEFNFNSENLTIETTIPYTVNNDGKELLLDFSTLNTGGLYYIRYYLPYDKDMSYHIKDRKDLPLVELLFVKNF